MCFFVISKSACLWTRIIALWAFVWFLPTWFISYDLCICMIDTLPLFCKSRLGGECDLCCFFYGYSQPCCSLLEASSINKLVHSLAGAFLSVQPDQMNNSEHSCTFSLVWMINDHGAPQCPDWPNDLQHSEQVWFFTHARFQRASHTKWLIALDTIVCSFFAVSD